MPSAMVSFPQLINMTVLLKYFKTGFFTQKWSDANAACQSIGGYLPMISSDSENQAIANMTQVFILFYSSAEKSADLIYMLVIVIVRTSQYWFNY